MIKQEGEHNSVPDDSTRRPAVRVNSHLALQQRPGAGRRRIAVRGLEGGGIPGGGGGGYSCG